MIPSNEYNDAEAEAATSGTPGASNDAQSLNESLNNYPATNPDPGNSKVSDPNVYRQQLSWGDLELIKQLIESNTIPVDFKFGTVTEGSQNWDYYISNGDTLLLSASRAGQIDNVIYLVEKGAQIDLKDTGGDSVLDNALLNKQIEVYNYLLSVSRPDIILASALRYPDALYTAISAMKPSVSRGFGSYWLDSPLLNCGQTLYSTGDGRDDSAESLDFIKLYGNTWEYYIRNELLTQKSPFYFVTEYKLPLMKSIHPKLIRACVHISKAENRPQLFDNELVSHIVECAWRTYGETYHICLTSLYLLLLGITTAINYTYHDWIISEESSLFIASFVLLAITIVLNTIFVVLEIIQVATQNSRIFLVQYVCDAQNYFDWGAHLLLYVVCFMRIYQKEETNYSAAIMSVATALLWIKLLYYLRPFKSTGPLIRMVFYITYRVKELSGILIIIVFACAQSLYLLTYQDESIFFADPFNGILQSYLYMLGQSELAELNGASNSQLAQFEATVFIFLSTILLLNLLIALMNNAYSEIANNQQAEWNRERATIMIEQYRSWELKIPKESYYLVRDDDLPENSPTEFNIISSTLESTDQKLVDIQASNQQLMQSVELLQSQLATVVQSNQDLRNDLSKLLEMLQNERK